MTATFDINTHELVRPPKGQDVLEDAVLSAFGDVAAGGRFHAALLGQLNVARKVRREMTPSGFYLDLRVEAGASLGDAWIVPGYVNADFGGRPKEQFADFILKADGLGWIRELEGFCYAGEWPTDVTDFTIRSSKEQLPR